MDFRNLWVWSHLLKIFIMENFSFYVVLGIERDIGRNLRKEGCSEVRVCEFLFENFIFLEPSPLSIFSHFPIEVMLRANTNVCFCI